jgi:hypothetical protein
VLVGEGRMSFRDVSGTTGLKIESRAEPQLAFGESTLSLRIPATTKIASLMQGARPWPFAQLEMLTADRPYRSP